MKTVLVTGARGFLGGALSKRLSSDSNSKVVSASREHGNSSNPFYVCDLSKKADVQKMIQEIKPDEIYHCAGSVGQNFLELMQGNVLNTWNILEALTHHSPTTKVVLMGSAAIYGNVSPAENPLPETSRAQPSTPYGLSKAAQTYLMQHYHQNHGLPVMEARIFNLCGKGAPEHLVNGRVERLIEEYKHRKIKEINLGFLGAKRDYIDVQEAAEMLVRIMARGTPGEIYNVGSGKSRLVRDLVIEMFRENDIPLSVLKEAESTGPQAMEVFADIRKFNQLSSSTGKK